MGPQSVPRPVLRRGIPAAIDPMALMGLVLVLALGASVWNFGRNYPQVDFFQFWAVGRLKGAGVTDIYSDPARHLLADTVRAEAQRSGSQRAINAVKHWPVLETYSTPFLYAVFGSISTGDYEFDSIVWQLLRFGAFLAAVLALCRLFRYSWAGSLVALAIILGTSIPLRNDLASGNVNEVQIGALAAFLVMRARWPTSRGDLASGVLLGLLIAFKHDTAPVAGLLVLLWVADRRFGTLARQAAGMSLGAAIAFAVGVLAWGSLQPWLDWVGAARDLATHAQYSLDQQNYALTRFLTETTGTNPGLLLGVGLAVAAAAAIARGRLNRKAGRRLWADTEAAGRQARAWFNRECLAVGAAIAIVLLGSPIAWLHYFTLLVPLQLFLLRPREDAESPVTAMARQVISAASAFLLAFVAIDPIIGYGAFSDSAHAIAAAVILLAMSLIALARRAPALPGPEWSVRGAA
jgi:hypothetical protein